jgi:death-on-curing protein
MKYLSADHVVAMHADLLERFGGDEGGGHRGEGYEGVDAAVQAVRNSYYESLEELAAAYAVYIVQGHVFMDGNKRTGYTAMLTFLTHNKQVRTLRDPIRTMVELQERAEEGERTNSLVRWLSEQLV